MSELALPESWSSLTWEEVTLDKTGFKRGPFGGSLKKEYFVESGYAVYEQYAPINDDCTRFRYFVDEAKYQEMLGFSVEFGDFLISCSGTMGKITQVPELAPAGIINQALLRIRLNEKLIDSSYFLHLFRSSDVQDRILKKSAGGAIQNLAAVKELKKTVLAIPVLSEQKIIVDKLNTHLTTVSQIQARLDAIPKLIEKFRQSVLNDAVSGELTEEWRETNETKSIDLNDITEFWREKYLADEKRYKSPTFESLSEKPILPNKWQYTQLGKVFDVYVGATPSRKESQYWSGDIPWVSSSEVAFRRIKDTKEKVTDVGVKNTSNNIHPVGTVMLAMIGQGKTRGQAAILDIEACHNQNTAAIRIPEPFVISDYLYFYLMKMYQENRMVGSGNNQKALNKSRVQSLAFRLPPINEQEQIVEQVNQLFAYADQIEKSVATAKARVDHLTQSILHQAFTGNLTAEWREQNPELITGDNSAEALLAKIKAEKPDSGKKKSNKG